MLCRSDPPPKPVMARRWFVCQRQGPRPLKLAHRLGAPRVTALIAVHRSAQFGPETLRRVHHCQAGGGLPESAARITYPSARLA